MRCEARPRLRSTSRTDCQTKHLLLTFFTRIMSYKPPSTEQVHTHAEHASSPLSYTYMCVCFFSFVFHRKQPETPEPTEAEVAETDPPVVPTPEPTEEVVVTPAPQSPTPEPTPEPTEPLTPEPTVRWTFAPADPWTKSPGAPRISKACPALR